MDLIFLTGMPGAGKTSVGLLLAKRLARTFVDLDGEIESRARKTIAAMFSEKDEKFFRDLETQVLADVCHQDRAVIALGGGTLERAENRDRVHAAGKLIYLKADLDVLVERIRYSAGRPLLCDTSDTHQLRRRLAELLQRRESDYLSAADVIDINPNLTASEIADRIVAALGPTDAN